MTHMARVLAFSGAILTVVAGSGCATHTPAPRIDPSSITTTSLTIDRVSPAPGAVTKRHTHVVAELTYSIAGFEPGQYYVGELLATTVPGRSISVGRASIGRPPKQPTLRQPSGHIRWSFPLSDAWDKPEIERRPIKVWFVLHKLTGAGTSRVVATTEPLEYQTK